MQLSDLENKRYFTIGDIVKITGVPVYSIRYWEKEFSLIKPIRKHSGHRRYTKEDIYVILEIRDFIYKKKMTLEGVKKYLNKIKGIGNKNNITSEGVSVKQIKLMKEIREEIKNII